MTLHRVFMNFYLVALLLFLLTIQTAAAGPLPDAPHIMVTGKYELRVAPDILTISLGIAETGFEVSKARDSVETRSKKLIDSCGALGIGKNDISSAQLQITPHYNWNNRAQIYAGTEVSRIITVTLRDLSRYDDLLRSILDAGVARIQSTRLSSSKETELQKSTLAGAIKNGIEKAKLMVAQLPQTVGPVYSVSEASSRSPLPQARYQAAKMGSQSAFEPGTIVFSKQLQLVFYLVKE